MAYDVSITKARVQQENERDYIITVNVTVSESGEERFNRDFSVRYYDQTTVDEIKAKLQNEIRTAWDSYMAEQHIFDAAAFDAAVSEMQAAMSTYVNS